MARGHSQTKQAAQKSLTQIRAQIAELETKIANLRIAEREVEALEPASQRRATPKAKVAQKPKPESVAKTQQTVGDAIIEVLGRNASLPLADIAEEISKAGRDVRIGTVSTTLGRLQSRGIVKSGGGIWKLAKASRAKRAGA
jgi:hypothetical protein